MRKLLNTLYVTNENIYMTLDGENVDASTDGSRDGRRGGSVSCCAGSHSIPQG